LSDFINAFIELVGWRILQRGLKLHQHYSLLSCKIDVFWRNSRNRVVLSSRHWEQET